jgi:hypothetical protein
MLLRKDVIAEVEAITTENLSAGEKEILFRVRGRVRFHIDNTQYCTMITELPAHSTPQNQKPADLIS